MIQFFCKCGQPMSVRPEYAGRTGTCPRCRQPVTVPAQSVTVPPSVPTGPTTAPYVDRVAPPTGRPPSAPQAAPAMPGNKAARLEVVHGPADVLGKVFSLMAGRPATVGRDPTAEVAVQSDRVSRRHCRLEPQANGSWLLADLGSSNGTLVNQVRIQRPQVLQGGEYIQTGDCLFRFVTG